VTPVVMAISSKRSMDLLDQLRRMATMVFIARTREQLEKIADRERVSPEISPPIV
jgi:hypothetical protein